jgi:DNA modification methylase
VTLFYQEPLVSLHMGHVLDVLAQMEPASVHCCVTSPPYFGLRNYQTEPQVWPDGWRGSLGDERTPFCTDAMLGRDCTDHCYLGHLLQVCDALFRVLRDDGVFWVNLGDSMAGSWGNQGRKLTRGTQRPITGPMMQQVHDERYPTNGHNTGAIPLGTGLKPKSLMNIPARFSIAMQARGWTLRSTPPWIKDNSMPESVEDRPSVSHEQIFLFSKRSTYFWDAEAVRHANLNIPRVRERPNGQPTFAKFGYNTSCGQNPNGRNRRTGDWWKESLDLLIADTEAWLAHAKQVRANGGLLLSPEGDPLGFHVNPQPYAEAHFATWPPKLVEPMIRASTSERGACSCGSPWKRVAIHHVVIRPRPDGTTHERNRGGRNDGFTKMPNGVAGTDITTIGWAPTCACGGYRIRTTTSRRLERHPWYRQHWQQRLEAQWPAVQECVLLDPFGGSGTTAVVSRRLGRKSVLIELSEAYCGLTMTRLNAVLPLFDEAPTSCNGQDAMQAEILFDT